MKKRYIHIYSLIMRQLKLCVSSTVLQLWVHMCIESTDLLIFLKKKKKLLVDLSLFGFLEKENKLAV